MSLTPHSYYGELLLDQQNFADAAASFDKAIELEKKKKGPLNVLPMVNKALCVFQWRQDFDTAEQLCADALQQDESCDVAVATYAQLLLQRNKIREAVEMFARGAALARTEPELVNALNFELVRCAVLILVLVTRLDARTGYSSSDRLYGQLPCVSSCSLSSLPRRHSHSSTSDRSWPDASRSTRRSSSLRYENAYTKSCNATL